MSYPTVVYLDENVDMLQPIAGYIDAKGIESILNYFGDDAYKTIDWPTYEASFKGNVGKPQAKEIISKSEKNSNFFLK